MADAARAHQLPHRDDARGEESTFFDFCALGEVRIQRCSHCGHHVYPPTGACTSCWSFALGWELIAGRGTVYSYSEHHRAGPGFGDRVPYVIALVDLVEGVRLMGQVLGRVDEVRIGREVDVVVRELIEGWPVPVFVMREESG